MQLLHNSIARAWGVRHFARVFKHDRAATVLAVLGFRLPLGRFLLRLFFLCTPDLVTKECHGKRWASSMFHVRPDAVRGNVCGTSVVTGRKLTKVGVFSINARNFFISDVHDGHNMLALEEIELRGLQRAQTTGVTPARIDRDMSTRTQKHTQSHAHMHASEQPTSSSSPAILRAISSSVSASVWPLPWPLSPSPLLSCSVDGSCLESP